MARHILIVGINIFGAKLRVGQVLRLKKQSDNEIDERAIFAELPYFGKVGYVCNVQKLLVKPCVSADFVRFDFENKAYARVEFIAQGWAICRFLRADELVRLDSLNVLRNRD